MSMHFNIGLCKASYQLYSIDVDAYLEKTISAPRSSLIELIPQTTQIREISNKHNLQSVIFFGTDRVK